MYSYCVHVFILCPCIHIVSMYTWMTKKTDMDILINIQSAQSHTLIWGPSTPPPPAVYDHRVILTQGKANQSLGLALL